MSSLSTKMSDTGRITVPLGVRAALGLEKGGPVVLDLVDGELRIRSVAQAMERARALTREMTQGLTGLSVDDFLADRRREAKRES
jgi:AbrB family looped-hinge helix DNA binding protein